MPQLVDQQQQDEADGEAEAPDQRVGADRDEHRPRRREELQLRGEQQDALELRAELRQHEADGGQPAADALEQRLLLADRLVLRGCLGQRIHRFHSGSGRTRLSRLPLRCS